jgi:hypothetical protein
MSSSELAASATQPRAADGGFVTLDRIQRITAAVLLGAASTVVLATVLLLATAHVADRFAVNHVSGHWMTLARYLSHGTLYPPLNDGHGHYFGTFYMPLPILTHGALAAVTGEYLVSGKLSAYLTALALFALMYVVLRRLRCSRIVSIALVAAVIATPTGLLAATSVRGDTLSVVFQLASVAVVANRRGRRALLLAAALCALGLMAKISALWAPVAIATWLLLNDRRQALRFVGAFFTFAAILFGAFELVSDGRLSENLLAFAFNQPADPGATPFSGVSTLLHLGFIDRDTLWLLFPIALGAAALSTWRRQPTILQLALVAELLVLAIVLRDVGADYNHLIDLAVLTALVVGELWGRLDGQRARSRAMGGMLALALVVSITSGYLTTLRPDVADAVRVALGRSHKRAFSTDPLAGFVPRSQSILSEDPAIPILRGQLPVTDPLLLSRMEADHPDWIAALERRIDSRQFDAVVLIRPLDLSSYHSVVSFGRTITAAIARNYRFKTAIEAGSPDYWIYIPR